MRLELLRQVTEKINNFRDKTGIEPTIISLNKSFYDKLTKLNCISTISISPKYPIEKRLFGLRIKVDDYQHSDIIIA